MSFNSILFQTIVVAILQSTPISILSQSQDLVANLASARLPSGRSHVSAIYDGDDSIYILGGNSYPSGALDSILHYSISEDRIATIGTLPTPMYGGRITMSSNNEVFLLGSLSSTDIVRFSPGVENATVVAQLPHTFYESSLIQFNGFVHILGGWVDMDATSQGFFPSINGTEGFRVNAALWINDSLYPPFYMIFGNILSTGENAVVRYDPVSEDARYTLLPELPHVFGHSMAFTDIKDGNVYLVGILGFFPGIARFEPSTNLVTLLPVSGFPGSDGNSLSKSGNVYVDKLNRIYMIGGRNSTREYRDEIWYIDLYPEVTQSPSSISTPSTTPWTTTTQNPEVFDCTNKTGGMYPHPEDCYR